MIPVTKPYLPPLKEYLSYLETIWDKQWLTNQGPLATELEQELKKHLKVKNLQLVNNGTIALQIAIKALALSGEIITTPFSYVASTSSIVWENCQPIFVDIDPDTFCIDPDKIENAITNKTTAILAVHIFGNPCDVSTIGQIAKKHKLSIIYDAAHAFNVRYEGQSILNFGDISTLSFHATKLYHTLEGGAIIAHTDSLAHRVSYMQNFGHKKPNDFYGLGINGKISEAHAAMGLCLLSKVEEIIAKRKSITAQYDQLLSPAPHKRQKISAKTTYNYAYYSVVFETEKQLLRVKTALNKQDIHPRRYFNPSLNTLNYVRHTSCPIAEDIAKKILCLPVYYELESSTIEQIAQIFLKHL